MLQTGQRETGTGSSSVVFIALKVLNEARRNDCVILPAVYRPRDG